MNDVAQAINVVQTATGCRVMLVPMAGDVQPAPTNSAILKPVEAVYAPAKVTGAVVTGGAQNALKSVSETNQKTAKRARKATKPAKEKAATLMTVAKFAELKGLRTGTVYEAIKAGRIPEDMVNRTSGAILIDSRAEIIHKESTHSRNPVKVFCKETKVTFDSISQAMKATGVCANSIHASLTKGITTSKGLTFTRA